GSRREWSPWFHAVAEAELARDWPVRAPSARAKSAQAKSAQAEAPRSERPHGEILEPGSYLPAETARAFATSNSSGVTFEENPDEIDDRPLCSGPGSGGHGRRCAGSRPDRPADCRYCRDGEPGRHRCRQARRIEGQVQRRQELCEADG